MPRFVIFNFVIGTSVSKSDYFLQLVQLLTHVNALLALSPSHGLTTEDALTNPHTSASKRRKTTTTGDSLELPMAELLLSLLITMSSFIFPVCTKKIKLMVRFTFLAKQKSFLRQMKTFASSVCIWIIS